MRTDTIFIVFILRQRNETNSPNVKRIFRDTVVAQTQIMSNDYPCVCDSLPIAVDRGGAHKRTHTATRNGDLLILLKLLRQHRQQKRQTGS